MNAPREHSSAAPLFTFLVLTSLVATSGAAAGQGTGGAEERVASAGGEAPTMTVSLSPLGEDGIRGTVTITRADQAENPRVHRIVVELERAEIGRTYSAAIQAGRCDAPGEVVAGLADVAARAGVASSSTIVTGDALVVRGEAPGPLLIRVHGEDGSPLACGDVPEPTRLARGGR